MASRGGIATVIKVLWFYNAAVWQGWIYPKGIFPYRTTERMNPNKLDFPNLPLEEEMAEALVVSGGGTCLLEKTSQLVWWPCRVGLELRQWRPGSTPWLDWSAMHTSCFLFKSYPHFRAPEDGLGGVTSSPFLSPQYVHIDQISFFYFSLLKWLFLDYWGLVAELACWVIGCGP